GKPKGVMVSHKNVIRLVKNTNFIKIPSQARLLQTGALEFDASTFEIWGSLLNGAGLVLVDKDTILDHCSLKKVINCNNITIMWMTSPMFNQVEDIELFAGLEYLLVGGDALSPAHINRVKRAYPSLKLINGYGPTENTTFSTTHLITNSGNKNERIPIGTPIANSSAYIVDKYGNPVPAGIPGELLVGGDGVARGYLNNPQLTHERFIPNPFIKAPQHTTSTHLTPKTSGTHLTPQTLYRTGDLVRMLPDGTIDFLERIDRQVKIRGFRIELGEIENRILEHEGVKEAVVIAREDAAADKYLCAYFVPAEKSPLNEPLPLKTFLSQKLPVYMVPAYFVKLEKIPLATTGKVDKAALPQPGNSTATQYAAPRNEQEEQLVRIYAEVLATDAGNIGIDDSFFYLGGHSLKATRLVSKIHKKLNVSIPLSEIFNIPTIRGLSAYIEKAAENKFLALQPAKKKENYSLSSAQKRLFLLQQLDTGSTVYNISETVQLEGTVDREKLEETFRRLLARHESLRTSFKIIDREPVQEIHPPGEVTFSIEYYDIEGQKNKEEDTARIIKQFIRPFDLSVAPLLRVGLIKPDENTTVRRESENPDQKRYILLINMHHIIADGTSVRVFEKEFMELYNGATLSPQKIQYKDYSEWQNSTPVKKALKEQEEYWLKQYTGELPVLTLPCDY
ncbi:MAG: AMP-binding protein, partial [bacterium]|nr:AMP-binding protein [bacterium]